MSTATAIKWTVRKSCPKFAPYHGQGYSLSHIHDDKAGPSAKRCSYCKRELLAGEAGTWAVVPWRHDARYMRFLDRAVRTFARKSAADDYARTFSLLVVIWYPRKGNDPTWGQ